MTKQHKNIILPTAYLPPIEYFYHLVNADEILIELHESYPKQTYRNRSKIFTANGILSLSIPVIRIHGNHTKTKDIQISYSDDWQKNHWRAIESAYNASPYFLYYKDELEIFYKKPFNTLTEFNTALLIQLLDFILCEKDIQFTEEYIKENKASIDLRNHFNPKKESSFECPKYFQVFEEKHGFQSNLSIIDLLFSEGPNTLNFLTKRL